MSKAKRGTHDREPFMVTHRGEELGQVSVNSSGCLVIEISRPGKLTVGIHDSRRIAGAILEQSVELTTRNITHRVKRDLRDHLSHALGLDDQEDEEE